MQAKHVRSGNAGFTLIELSIVLIVIGLIIGSVLLVNSIIQSARVTSTIRLLQGVQSAVATYNQNYNALPGDDLQAAARFPNDNVGSGGGNGIIGADTLTSTFEGRAAQANGDGGAESGMLWQHLRAAALVKGMGSDRVPPGNPFGGVVGVQNGAFANGGIALGTNVICLSQIPGAAARILDQNLDDGDATTGKVLASTTVTDPPTAYLDGNTYVVCTAL